MIKKVNENINKLCTCINEISLPYLEYRDNCPQSGAITTTRKIPVISAIVLCLL